MNHEPVDRVPTFEYAIDPQVVNGICPGGTYADVADALELDAVTAWFSEAYTPLAEKRRPGEVFVDEWGVKREHTGEMSSFPLEENAPIAALADLRNYVPPDPLRADRFQVLQDYLRRFRGDRMVSFAISDPFDLGKNLMGTTEYLMAFYENPPLVEALYDLATEWVIAAASKAIDLGADLIICAGDLGFKNGTWVHPGIMERIHLPRLKRFVDAVHRRRAYFFYHSHGNIESIFELMIATGTDVIHPIDPEAGMDLAAIKKAYGARVALAGNISTDLLSRGTAADIDEAVRQAMAAAKGGSGYILTAASSLHSAVNPANYTRMIEACRRYGQY